MHGRRKNNKKIIIDTPETIGSGCMTGRVPSEQEFKKLETFFANRKIKKIKSKKQKILQKLTKLKYQMTY